LDSISLLSQSIGQLPKADLRFSGLKEHHPQYRQPTLRKLYQKICALKDTPYIGRPGHVDGTRELLFRPMPYIAVYRVTEDAIEVWCVYHSSQNRS
jgi:toxin ParE1/3/4